jgi:outer membrane protein assembly factor BamB
MQKGSAVDEKAAKAGRIVFRKAYDPEAFAEFDHAGAAWHKPDLDVNALALARDAILVAHADGVEDLHTWNSDFLSKRQGLMKVAGWKLTALARTDGKELWSVALPSEPLYNGLAIAADGSIVVTLRDGSLVAVRKSPAAQQRD